MRMTGLLIAAAMALGAAAPAAAALVMVEQVDVDFGPRQINGFDGSLGTLTRVELLLQFDTQTGLLRPEAALPSAGPTIVNVSGIARLETLSGRTLADASVTGLRVYGPGQVVVDGYAVGVGSDALTSAVDLAFFTGTAPKFVVTDADLAVSATSGSGPANVTATGFERIRAQGTIFYYYEAAVAPVPEPASWAMMIGGFGLVGGAMRWRSHARPAFA